MIPVPGLALSIRLGPSPVSSSPFAGFPPTLSNGAAWVLILPFPSPMQKMDCRLARLLQPLDNIPCQVVKISIDESVYACTTLSHSLPLCLSRLAIRSLQNAHSLLNRRDNVVCGNHDA
jgi:hypothetical protein